MKLIESDIRSARGVLASLPLESRRRVLQVTDRALSSARRQLCSHPGIELNAAETTAAERVVHAWGSTWAETMNNLDQEEVP